MFQYVWIAYASGTVSLVAVVLAALRLSKAPKLRSLESKLVSLASEFDELVALAKRMDARDRMRAVRSAKTATADSSSTTMKGKSNGRPDPFTQPAEWKAHMRAEHPPIGPHNPPKDDA